MDSLMVKAPANCSRFRSRLRAAAAKKHLLPFNSKHKNNNSNNNNTGGNNNGRGAHLKLALKHQQNKINNHHHHNNKRGRNYNNSNKGSQRAIVHHHSHHLTRKILHLDSATIASNNNNNNNNERPSSSLNGKRLGGDFTRKIYEVISNRIDNTQNIPSDMVQTLFNDMHLFPSNSEVSDMIHSVRQFNIRNGKSPTFITRQEFCVLVREMQKFKLYKTATPRNNKCVKKCEVFLGGSCNPTTWRADTAIPVLQKQGITYYNPQVAMWAPELVAQEHDAKQAASVLLYVVDSQTRSVAGMIEVAYLVSAGRCVVLVADSYKYGQTIMGETLTDKEFQDLVEGQTSLLNLVQQQGIKVHVSLSSALEQTAGILKNSSTLNGSVCNKIVLQKFRKLSDVFNGYDKNRTGDIHIHDALDAYKRITNRSLDISSIYNYLTIPNNVDRKISFDQFCALIAEFGTDGYESIPINEWARQPMTQRQHSTNNNNNTVSECEARNAKNATSATVGQSVDVYLGGPCKTSWRDDNVTSLIAKHRLTYYNPAMREGNGQASDPIAYEDNVIRWKRQMDNSRVLLFVITKDRRSLTTMILAAHYIGLERPIVVCIEHLPSDDLVIDNEKLTKQAIKDYNRGRVYLADLAKRKSVPVFDNVADAVNCAIEKCRQLKQQQQQSR